MVLVEKPGLVAAPLRIEQERTLVHLFASALLECSLDRFFVSVLTVQLGRPNEAIAVNNMLESRLLSNWNNNSVSKYRYCK